MANIETTYPPGLHKQEPLKRNIRTQASDPTIKHLCERIEKGRLKTQHDFQRKYVWRYDAKLRSRLIESVLLEVPIPTIYTAEEDDGTEVVIDGQQRLTTFHQFLRNEFRLSGLSVCKELNHQTYKSLGDIDPMYQEKIDSYPLRVIKILKDSDASVRFDIFERLNRGSVKLNDQELRNCIYRGPFNDLLKEVSQDANFQVLLGSREHPRMQDAELALRFFAIHDMTYLNYRGAMKNFLNAYMKANQNMEPFSVEKHGELFKQAASMVRTVMGDKAFFLYTIKDNKTGVHEKVVNKGLFDVLMFSFTRYTQHQVMPYKDAIKEELFYLMTDNEEFLSSITGAGTDSRIKLERKFRIWLQALNEIVGSLRSEPRCFSWQLKSQLWEKSPICQLCSQHIESINDAEVDHIEFYWRGGRTIPENARLVHRFCNRSRRPKVRLDDIQAPSHEQMVAIEKRVKVRQAPSGAEQKGTVESYDRQYWESKASKESLRFVDRLMQLTEDFAPGFSLKYNKQYIGVAQQGVTRNFIAFQPTDHNVILHVNYIDPDALKERLDNSGLTVLGYFPQHRQYRIRLTERDLEDKTDTLKWLMARAYESYQTPGRHLREIDQVATVETRRGLPQLSQASNFQELAEIINIRSTQIPTCYMDKLLLTNQNKRISEILKEDWRPYAERIGDKHFTGVADVRAHIKFRQERGWEYDFKGDSDDPIVRLVGFNK